MASSAHEQPDRLSDFKWFTHNWIDGAADQDTVKRKRAFLLDETKRECKDLVEHYRSRIYDLVMESIRSKQQLLECAEKEARRFPKAATGASHPGLSTASPDIVSVANFLKDVGYSADTNANRKSKAKIRPTEARARYVTEVFTRMKEPPPQFPKDLMEFPNVHRQLNGLAQDVFGLLALWHYGHIGHDYTIPPFKYLPMDFAKALQSVSPGSYSSYCRRFSEKLDDLVKLEKLRQFVCRTLFIRSHEELAQDTEKMMQFVHDNGKVFRMELMGKDASYSSFEEKHWVPRTISALLDDQDLAKHKYFFSKLESLPEFKTFAASLWMDLRPQILQDITGPSVSSSQQEESEEQQEIRRQKRPIRTAKEDPLSLWKEDETACESLQMVIDKQNRLSRVVDLGVQAAVKMYQTKIKDLQVERAKRKESVQEDADTKLAKLNSTDT